MIPTCVLGDQTDIGLRVLTFSRLQMSEPLTVASSSLARTLGECLTFTPRLRFKKKYEVVISSRTPVSTFLGQDQSTVAQRAETTMAEFFVTRCV